MAKLNRRLTKIFAENSSSQGTAVYGSKKMGNVQYSKDIEVLQNNKYQVGREEGVIDKKAPVLQEENTIDYVLSHQIKYINQMGVCEWYNKETYYVDSIVNVGGNLYVSLQNDNINHNPLIDTQYWKLLSGSNVNNNNLFDYKISDRNLTQEDNKWSQYSVYTAHNYYKGASPTLKPTACQILKNLYDNGTGKTETIAGETITYKEAINRMKIFVLVHGPSWYYFTLTGSHQYIYFAGDNSYSIRNIFNPNNFVRINKGININNTFHYIAYKNFVFTSASDVTTLQTIIGRDIVETNIGGGFWLYIENGSVKLQLFQGENANANVNPTLSVTLFSIEPSTTYLISFSYDARGSYSGNGTIKASLTKTTDQTTITMEQSFSGFGSIKVNSLLFIGADQKLTADGTVSDYAKWTDFNMFFFLIEYQVNNTLTTYNQFYIPQSPTNIERLYYKTGMQNFWGFLEHNNELFLLPPRNDALIGNQQVYYSSQGLMLNYTARNFNGYSYTATDDCVAFFNSKVMYSYCYAFVNGVQVFNSGMNGSNDAVGSNSITIPLKKGDVLTFQQESSGGGGSKDSVLYVYRKKYVVDTNRNEQVFYYLY